MDIGLDLSDLWKPLAVFPHMDQPATIRGHGVLGQLPDLQGRGRPVALHVDGHKIRRGEAEKVKGA